MVSLSSRETRNSFEENDEIGSHLYYYYCLLLKIVIIQLATSEFLYLGLNKLLSYSSSLVVKSHS